MRRKTSKEEFFSILQVLQLLIMLYLNMMNDILIAIQISTQDPWSKITPDPSDIGVIQICAPGATVLVK
jgi:hypothetical protein